MPVFNDAGATLDNQNGRYHLPNGFLGSFIVVPLFTYLICIAVVWTMGFNARDRRLSFVMISHAVGFFSDIVFRRKRTGPE